MDKAKVTLRGQWGFSQLASDDNWMMMNTPERIQFEKEIGLDAGKDYNLLSRTDVNWLDKVFNDRAPLQSYELSVNRATDRLNYYVSGGFYDQDGIAQSSTFRRYNMRTNAEVKASNWLKIGTNTMMAYEEVSQAEEGDMALFSPISGSRFMLPYWNPYNADGSLASENNGTWKGIGQNPIEWMANNPVKHEKYKLLSTVFADVTPLKNLTIHAQFGVDYAHSTSFMQSYPSYLINNKSGRAGRSTSDMLNLTETLTANYRWALNDDHSFNFLLGQEGVDYRSAGFQVVTRGQTIDRLTNIASGTRASSWQDASTAYSYLSLFFRGEYNYKDLYYAEVAARTDASSRFGKDHRWGAFWSLGFMWNIKNEVFLKDVEWIDNLKYKISYGSQGNDFLLQADGKTRNRYPYMDQFTVSNNNGQPAISQYYKGNQELKWETNYNFNPGIEFNVLNNRLSGGFEFFTRTAKDLLFDRPLATSSGNTSYPDNIGDMRNTGFELELSGVLIETKNVKWNLSLNATTYKNKIKKLPPEKKESGVWKGKFKLVEGGSFYDYYIKEWAGVDPEDGSAMWYKDIVDENGNVTGKETTKLYSEASDYNMASALPKLYGGINTSLDFFGFDFSMNLSYQLGGKGYDATYAWLMHSGDRVGTNFHNDILNAWTPENRNTDVPKLNQKASSAASTSSRFLVSASYLNLQNISLGYTLPKDWIRKIKCENLRIYVVADNVALLSGRRGYDPRVNWNGETNYSYSAIRTISGGVTLKF